MNDKVKAWVEKTPAKNINVCFAYNEDTQEIILTKDGVINRIDVSTLISHNEKDDTETIFFPRNATNGDVIKAVFPNIEREDNYGDADYYLLNGKSAYTPKLITFKSWWNAPYKTESEERNENND